MRRKLIMEEIPVVGMREPEAAAAGQRSSTGRDMMRRKRSRSVGFTIGTVKRIRSIPMIGTARKTRKVTFMTGTAKHPAVGIRDGNALISVRIPAGI